MKMRVILLAAIGLGGAARALAQCDNWAVSAQLVTASACAGSGVISTTLTGPDAGNITNVQYGIPLSGAGAYAVPLNNSATFSNVPPGYYQVSAVGQCGGNYVGRNTMLQVPGTYVPLFVSYTSARPTVGACSYGLLTITVADGAGPFTYKLLSAPPGYTGPLTVTVPETNYTFTNLPSGNYSMQVVDACGSGTAPEVVAVGSINSSSIVFDYSNLLGPLSCDSIFLSEPHFGWLDDQPNAWTQYNGSELITWKATIDSNVFAPTALQPLSEGGIALALAPGKTLKDCYGKTVTYEIHLPCGQTVIHQQEFSPFYVNINQQQDCMGNVGASLSPSAIFCGPLQYTVINLATGAVVSSFTSPTGYYTLAVLPAGIYSISYTTADGYTGQSYIATQEVSPIPYSLSIGNGAEGLHNYAGYFEFHAEAASYGNRTVELFNAPPGYYYNGTWPGYNTYYSTGYYTATPDTLKYYPPGDYVWKITDECGVYYLPYTITQQELHQFSVSIADSQVTCQGLKMTIDVTAIANGQPVPATFGILLNGHPHYYMNGASNAFEYPSGSTATLTQPGNYTIVTGSTESDILLFGNYYQGYTYPNALTTSYSFTYSGGPVQVDAAHTQGFACDGAGTGSAVIYTAATGGILNNAASGSGYYDFSLMEVATGQQVAQNETGVFSGFGGSAGGQYSVIVTDACGAFATQPVTILDLSNAHLIYSSSYVACLGDTVQLTGAYLPGATYTWTGPGGFSSTLQNPTLPAITQATAGYYHLSVTTPLCATPAHDSVLVVVNGNPPAPLLSLDCGPPFVITLSNTLAGYQYVIKYGQIFSWSGYFTYEFEIDLPYSTYTQQGESYQAFAVDTTTGCRTGSEIFSINSDPDSVFAASVYSPHLQVCSGDTTILVAQPASPGQAYQWFKNGVALPGATAVSYVTNQPGNYKVRISSPPCGLDTSAEVTVSAVTLPTATITAPVTQVCQGDTAWIQANTGAGFSYSWLLNGATVPAQHGPVLPAWQQGTYQCIVSNGGCIAVSGTVGITVIPGPVVALSPGTDQYLCAGAAVLFSTPEEPGYSYVWRRDGVVIPGATGAVYSAAQAGSYQVIVSNPQCPGVPSAAVAVIIASALQLGNDTTVCAPGAFAIPLAAGGLDDTVQWSTGSTLHSIMVTAAGTYWVQVTNSCGVSSDTIHIRTINAYLPNLPPDTLICNAASIAVLSVPALLQNVQWSTGSGLASISVNTPGLYWVTGVSPCGVLTDTVVVAFCPPQILSLELASDSVCAGDCASVSARVKQYPTGFLWLSPGGTPAQQGGSAGPVPVCYAAPGVYPITCIATNIAGADTMQTQVVVLAKPVPRFADTVMTAAYKTTLHLPACAAAQSADWYLGDSLVCENCSYITLDARLLQSTYHCVVRNGGCTDTCAYLLHVTDIPHEVWMPDAFTPNGDGRNEVFRIITDNPNIHSMELSVYDRWGARLYTGRNTRQGWDGTNNGHTASAGVYFWTLRYKVLGTDEVFYQKGDVTLLR